MTTIPRTPLDRDHELLPQDGIFLRVWTPHFNHLAAETPIELSIRREQLPPPSPGRHRNPSAPVSSEQRWTLHLPMALPDESTCERVYTLSPNLVLEPEETYSISGRLGSGNDSNPIFNFAFQTDDHGKPVAY